MAETINMPKLGFDMAEGTLVRWVKDVGDAVNKGEVLAEIETDKATVEVESALSGTVLQLLVNQGDVVPVNAPIAIIGEAGEKVETPKPSGAQVSAPEEKPAPQPGQSPAPVAPLTASPELAPSQPAEAGFVKASPLARKIARDRKVDLSKVQGSGPGGRIVRRDIQAALAAGAPSEARPEMPSAQAALASQPDTRIPLTKLRQAIGRRLVEAKTTIPHFYVTHEFRMDDLLVMRKQINAYLPDGEKTSVNDFIVKAAALALRRFPNLNAVIQGTDVIQFGRVNVGVAVTVPGGLMTVVVKDTDQKTLRQISTEIKVMAARAREGKVKPEDVDGSTFSTSNLGMYDVEDFIAIINPPEAAILAIGSAREAPVVSNGQVVPGWRMKATISVDHRISDGAEAAQFMQALAGYLEEPLRLLM